MAGSETSAGAVQACATPLSADPLGSGRTTILETLGNLGDFVGGIAVIVTLVYLAFQVRQTKAIVSANSVRELTEGILSANEHLCDRENTEIYLRGASDYSALTPDERLRFGLLIGFFLARLDTVLEYRKRGMVNDAYVAVHTSTIKLIFDNPGVRDWFDRSTQSQTFTGRVRVWVNENTRTVA